MTWLHIARRIHGTPRSKGPWYGNIHRDRERKLCRRIWDEEGASTVEAAVACTILLAVLVGVFDMCLAAYSAHSVSEIAREATRYAIVRGSQCVNLSGCGASNSDIQTYVQGLGYPGIKPSKLTTTTTWCIAKMDTTVTPNTVVLGPCATGTPPPGYNDPGDQVQVKVSYPFSFSIPFYGSKTLSLASTSAMVISQ